MSYYEMNGLGGWMPSGNQVAKATQGAVGVFAGATIAKFVTNFFMDFTLNKTVSEAGVVTIKFKPKGSETEVEAKGFGAKDLDAGRPFGGGMLFSSVVGLAPVVVGLGFYAKGQDSDAESNARVWMTSTGLGMIGYGIGHIIKGILERVDVDYSSTPDQFGAYSPKTPASTWAQKSAAILPFGAVDSYESNIVINGLGYAGPVRGYMRRGMMNGLGYSRNPGAPTFVERLNGGIGRAPAEIQTLAAAPSTIEPVSLQGLAATLM